MLLLLAIHHSAGKVVAVGNMEAIYMLVFLGNASANVVLNQKTLMYAGPIE